MKSDTGGSADSRFMMKAAEGGMAEVQMGNLAKDRASSDAVKQFGHRMVDDHTKAGDELKSLASQKNVTLPTDVDADTKAVMDHLQTLNGAAFDHAYMAHMVSDHKTDVSEFQREASGGSDADVKAWAAKTLPTLQDHLKQAQDVNSQLGK
jgi:putative membrane protein